MKIMKNTKMKPFRKENPGPHFLKKAFSPMKNVDSRWRVFLKKKDSEFFV
jgi:hypothetical protein